MPTLRDTLRFSGPSGSPAQRTPWRGLRRMLPEREAAAAFAALLAALVVFFDVATSF